MNEEFNCVKKDECAEYRKNFEVKHAVTDTNVKNLYKIITAILSVFSGVSVSILAYLLLH